MPSENTQPIDEPNSESTDSGPTNRDSALALLQKGLRTIPLGGHMERPPAYFIKRHGGDNAIAMAEWPKAARRKWAIYQRQEPTEAEVTQWWKQWPDANIAILTGYEVYVVDADSPEAIEWCEKNLIKTPWRVDTRRGRHYYYGVAPGSNIKNSTNAKAKIDIRGKGGYVVAPGSTHHTGFKYEWNILEHPAADNYTDLPELTTEMVEKIRTYNGDGTSDVTANSDCIADLRKYQLPPGRKVKEGERNSEAARLAGSEYRQLSENGIDGTEALASVTETLFQWNSELETPLTDDEFINVAVSVQKTHEKRNAIQIAKVKEQLLNSAVLNNSSVQQVPDHLGRKIPKATHSEFVIKFSGSGSLCLYRKVKLDNGVGVDDEGNKVTLVKDEEQWVSGAVWVVGTARSHDAGEWFKVVQFVDNSGAIKMWLMPRSLDMAPHRDLLKHLYDHGLFVASSGERRHDLAFYLSKDTKDEYYLATRTGWHDSPKGLTFLLPGGRQIGNSRCVLEDSTQPLRKAGSLESWQSHISMLCQGNSRLVFALSASFASSLLLLTNGESGGFHFQSSSSIGKTTLLDVARSTAGLEDRKWRTTDNALESVAALHSDIGLTLDEIGEAPADKLGEMTYMLSDGRGKERLGRDARRQPVYTWRVVYLSSGELSPSEHQASEGKRAKAGQELRLLTIDADAGYGLGIFDTLLGRNSSQEFVDELKVSSELHCGYAAEAFIKFIINNQQFCIYKVAQIKAQFNDEWQSIQGENPQVGRASTRFAFIAAAGELATAAGITGWPEGEALAAARVCFQSWRSTWAPKGAMESQQAIDLTAAFLLNNPARFDAYDRGSVGSMSDTKRRAGFIKHDGNEVRYCIFPEVFRTEVCRGMNYPSFTKALQKAGYLETDSAGSRAVPMSPNSIGKKIRLVVIKSSILEAANDN